MTIHQELSKKTGVDRDGRVRPSRFSWIIPAIVSALVALVFLANLKPDGEATVTPPPPTEFSMATAPQVAGEILHDIKLVLRSQFDTLKTIALFAFVPGLFGLIYRKKFWPWFLSAFAILFVANLIGFETGIGSVSSETLKKIIYNDKYWVFFGVEAFLVGLFLAFRLRRHTTGAHKSKGPKNIVVCLDGTWNHPGQTDWGHLAQTNVFKIFDSLKETEGAKRPHINAARSKHYYRGTQENQVAFYYNGVGNKVENSVLGEKIGGAFGLGAEAIKERAYLDVAREYQPGDRIFIFGFSRGAALARMVASALDKRGVPKVVWTLRIFGRQRPVKTSKEHLPVEIEVLGCWDTVGAFGISKDILGIPFQKIDLLKDLTVDDSVKRAYHLVALDEDRDAFVPTLMDPDPTNPKRVVEVWFSGNHSNVGGGFATDGLSDHTLSFMLERVSSAWNSSDMTTIDNEDWGLFLEPGRILKPNPLGKLRVSGGAMYVREPRAVPLKAIIHDSVFDRIQDRDSTYVPDSLFQYNHGIHELRTKVTGEIEILKKTRSVDDTEAGKIAAWVESELTAYKWSKASTTLSIDPASELSNR